MTESLRTLDRLRLRVKLADTEIARRRAKILELIASLDIVDIDAAVSLDRAALAFRALRVASAMLALLVFAAMVGFVYYLEQLRGSTVNAERLVMLAAIAMFVITPPTWLLHGPSTSGSSSPSS